MNSKIVWNGNTLLIPWADTPTSWSDPREGSDWAKAPSGEEDAWITGTDYKCALTARWTPATTQTFPAASTGWDGATGFRAFLEYARQKNDFAFHKDAAGAGITSRLLEPMDGEPPLESDGTRSIRLVVWNPTSAYDGIGNP